MSRQIILILTATLWERSLRLAYFYPWSAFRHLHQGYTSSCFSSIYIQAWFGGHVPPISLGDRGIRGWAEAGMVVRISWQSCLPKRISRQLVKQVCLCVIQSEVHFPSFSIDQFSYYIVVSNGSKGENSISRCSFGLWETLGTWLS